MVQHFVQLQRDQVIDLRNARIDHRLGVFRHRHRAFEHLADEIRDQILAAIPGRGVARKPALLDDLIEQT